MQASDSQSILKVATSVVAVVVLIGLVVLIEFVEHQQKSANSVATSSPQPATSSQTSPSSSSSTPITTPSNSSNTSSGYKDGTYRATSEYYVPHGSESISVTLTVANGVVTNSSIKNSENDYDSARYQEDFASQYKSHVVGKNLSDVNLSYIAGASDTTRSFNDAVSQIQSEAKA